MKDSYNEIDKEFLGEEFVNCYYYNSGQEHKIQTETSKVSGELNFESYVRKPLADRSLTIKAIGWINARAICNKLKATIILGIGFSQVEIKTFGKIVSGEINETHLNLDDQVRFKCWFFQNRILESSHKERMERDIRKNLKRTLAEIL